MVLSDREFKVAFVTDQEVKGNKFWHEWKDRSSQQSNRNSKKNQMDIFRAENIISKIKKNWMGLREEGK